MLYNIVLVFAIYVWSYSSVGKESACNAGDPGSIPGSGRSTGEGIGSVQSLSCVRLFATPWTAACQTSLSITNSQSLLKLKLKLISIALVIPSNHLILCCPLLLPPSIFPSIRVFSNELVLCIRWSKYWSFSFSINPPNEYSGLISFRIDRLDLLAVQGIGYPLQCSWASLVAQLVKNLPAMLGDLSLIPGLGRSPREGKGYPLQYSGLENSMDCI